MHAAPRTIPPNFLVSVPVLLSAYSQTFNGLNIEQASQNTLIPIRNLPTAGIYQAAQNMASGHLCELCNHVPKPIRTELIKLKDRKSSAGSGKKYWADGVRVLGVYEGSDGLRFYPR